MATDQVVTRGDIGTGLAVGDDNKLTVAVSTQPGNTISVQPDGIYATGGAGGANNFDAASNPVSRHPLNWEQDVAEPSYIQKAEQRGILYNRNGMNVLHLDFRIKEDYSGSTGRVIARLPDGAPTFVNLTEVMLNNGRGSVYIEAGSNEVKIQGELPARARLFADLIQFSN